PAFHHEFRYSASVWEERSTYVRSLTSARTRSHSVCAASFVGKPLPHRCRRLPLIAGKSTTKDHVKQLPPHREQRRTPLASRARHFLRVHRRKILPSPTAKQPSVHQAAPRSSVRAAILVSAPSGPPLPLAIRLAESSSKAWYDQSQESRRPRRLAAVD